MMTKLKSSIWQNGKGNKRTFLLLEISYYVWVLKAYCAYCIIFKIELKICVQKCKIFVSDINDKY